MTPRRKGEIPDDHAAALTAAVEADTAAKAAKDEARAQLAAAVVAALKAGGSVREVARFCGISRITVEKWGHDGGWPTAEQKAKWDAERQANAEWNARAEAARKLIQHMEGEGDEDR